LSSSCTLCCQFLCIIIFWLPFRYSLMFICCCLVNMQRQINGCLKQFIYV
jgi:hypothetical protein